MKNLGVSYTDLKNIIFSVFIQGGDYEPTERDTEIIDSKSKTTISNITKQLASFQSSLLLNNFLRRTQALQLNEIGNYLQM
jgi:predicted DNA-binding ArsR family transcriptional regulator